jgi:hypothetical protein
MNIEDYQDAEKRTCVTTDPDDTIKLALTGQESGSILYELDLGLHILFLMSDGSIDLLVNEEKTPSLAETGLHLDSDETYRLFISLHEQLKHMDTYRGDERTSKPTDSSPLAKK